MRAKTLMLFMIAISCGLVASIGVSQYMERGRGRRCRSPRPRSIVAASDINIGQKLDANNVRLEEWPKDRVPDGALTELEDLTDRFPRTRLYSGRAGA